MLLALNCGYPAVLAWLSLQVQSSQATPGFYLSRGQKSGELKGVWCQPTLASVVDHVLQCYEAMWPGGEDKCKTSAQKFMWYFFFFFFSQRRQTTTHLPHVTQQSMCYIYVQSRKPTVTGTSTVDGDTEQLSRANGPWLHCFNLICGTHRVLQHKPWSTNNYLVHISFKSNGQINPERIEPPLWLAYSVQDLSIISTPARCILRIEPSLCPSVGRNLR